jgi:hypothetical protein
MGISTDKNLYISSSSAFHDEDLTLTWLQNERPEVYQSGILHGYNCRCCSKVPKISNVPKKPKQGRKAEVHKE